MKREKVAWHIRGCTSLIWMFMYIKVCFSTTLLQLNCPIMLLPSAKVLCVRPGWSVSCVDIRLGGLSGSLLSRAAGSHQLWRREVTGSLASQHSSLGGGA